MRRGVLMVLCVGCALLLTSCRDAAERTVRKIRLEGVEQVRMESLSTLGIDLLVENGTAHKLRAEHAEVKLRYKGSEVASMRLQEPVEVSRRTRTVVATRWRIDLRNPLAMLAVVRSLGSERYEELTVDLSVEGSGGPIPVNISREKVPLSNFLNIFGIEPDFLTSILQESL